MARPKKTETKTSGRPKWYSLFEKLDGTTIMGDYVPDFKKLLFPSPSLNLALGGGLLEASIACVYGPESSGKSLLALLAAVELQRSDPEALVLWYDVERNVKKKWEYFLKLGIDPERFIVVEGNTFAKVFDHFKHKIIPMVKAPEIKLPIKMVVIDSLKALEDPKELAAKSVEDFQRGGAAMFIGKGMKSLIDPINDHRMIAIIIQQVSMQQDPYKIPVTGPYVVSGGKQLHHYSDYMIFMEAGKTNDEKILDSNHFKLDSKGKKVPIQIGHKVKIRVEKNRLGAPFQTAVFNLINGVGIVDQWWETAEISRNYGIAERNGNTWSLGEYSAGSIEKWNDLVKSTPELQKIILDKAYNMDFTKIAVDSANLKPLCDLGLDPDSEYDESSDENAESAVNE